MAGAGVCVVLVAGGADALETAGRVAAVAAAAQSSVDRTLVDICAHQPHQQHTVGTALHRHTRADTHADNRLTALFPGLPRWRSTVVERRSLRGELSLSCARPAADG